MTDRIPDEIMREAMRIARDIECMPSDGNVRLIANALLRERQRAAEIARKAYATIWDNLSEGDEMSSLDGDAIAEMILSYDEAQK